jgi:hypothetical protein
MSSSESGPAEDDPSVPRSWVGPRVLSAQHITERMLRRNSERHARAIGVFTSAQRRNLGSPSSVSLPREPLPPPPDAPRPSDPPVGQSYWQHLAESRLRELTHLRTHMEMCRRWHKEMEILYESEQDTHMAWIAESMAADTTIKVLEARTRDLHRDLRQIQREHGLLEVQFQELEGNLSTERVRRLCLVCQTRVRCVLLRPCRHLACCDECSKELAQRASNSFLTEQPITSKCPVCRALVQSVEQVFVP